MLIVRLSYSVEEYGMYREISLSEANDLVNGAQILGTGGGGNAEIAKEDISKIYSLNKTFKIQDITEFSLDDMICIIGMVGGGISEQDKKFVQGLHVITDNVMLEAVHELEQHLGTKFNGFVATEIGPGNIVVPLKIATLLNRVTVDGDMCGRSKPKISISTTRIVGIPITPLAIVSAYGDRLILKDVVSDSRAEDICRSISRLTNGTIGVARCPMKISEAKKALVKGTISLAIQLGSEIRNTIAQKNDPLPVIERVLNAELVFMGRVKEFNRTEKSGFTSGEFILESQNNSLKVLYQNEYLISWLNGEQYITCPDSLLIVDRKTGRGLTPWEEDFAQQDLEVAVFARESALIWQTKTGLDIFGPQVFQADLKYRSFKRK
jgi:DUF917 family protein